MKGIIAIIFTITVCIFILGSEWYWLKYPPGSVPTESRKMAVDLLTFIVGVVSGYLGSNHK